MDGKRIVLLQAVILFVVCIIPMHLGDWSEDIIRWSIRRSVDIAFPFFFFSFGASSLHFFFQSDFTAWLLKNRRYIGIAFAVAFLLHAGQIVIRALLYPEPFISGLQMERVYPGLAGYLMVTIMLLTSNNLSMKLLGAKLWKMIHRVGGYYLLFLFAAAYFPRLKEPFFYPYIVGVVALIIMRLVRANKRRKLAA